MRRTIAALALLAAMLSPAFGQDRSVSIAQVTVVPNAAAYTAGNCLGGVLTVPGVTRTQGQSGAKLIGVSFVDGAHNTVANDAMTLFVFDAPPINGTYADHAACNIAAADLPNLIGAVSIGAANCAQDAATNTVCTITPTLPITVRPQPVVRNSIYVLPVVAATPTYGAAMTLYFNFGTESY
jgi:hypothetical protein